jgi:hypothetical protein
MDPCQRNDRCLSPALDFHDAQPKPHAVGSINHVVIGSAGGKVKRGIHMRATIAALPRLLPSVRDDQVFG